MSVTKSPTMIARSSAPPALADRLHQRLRIGLGDAERVLAADEREPIGDAELAEQQARGIFQLVGADREPPARAAQRVEACFDAGNSQELSAICAL